MKKEKKNDNDLIKTIEDALKMKVGQMKDEWKTPSVVLAEDAEGIFLQTRAGSRAEAIELRDKIKAAVEAEEWVQGYISFIPEGNRFSQILRIINRK